MSEAPLFSAAHWSDELLASELAYDEMIAETTGPSLHWARQRAREAIHVFKTEIERRRAAKVASS